MSVLRSIEHRIESIVEGVFGRAFRTHVQPVELARKLAKEMDEAKSVSVSRVYVPNEYTLYLCPSDRDQFSSYALLSTPVVLMEEDEDLNVGEFGIATRMVQPERPQAPTPPDVVPQAAPSHTRVYRPAVTEAVSAEVAEEEDLARAPSTLVVAGARHELDDRVLVLGRSHDCDITVDDANVSRRHAEVRHEDGSYWIVDLGSTNGVVVNGKRVERAQLEPDDEILLGTTVVRFERGY
jgi:pSer/pThr/pTyr-binding forkhead associated (FHA) protein